MANKADSDAAMFYVQALAERKTHSFETRVLLSKGMSNHIGFILETILCPSSSSCFTIC